MSTQLANDVISQNDFAPLLDHPRHVCQHITKSSHRCHIPLAPQHQSFCTHHLKQSCAEFRKHARTSRLAPTPATHPFDDSADLSALLSQPLSQRKSAADIHALLWNLSLALQQGRVSPRRAAALAYIHSLLLRTLPAIEKHSSPGDEHDGVPRVLVGIPRPIRNRPPVPPPLPTPPRANDSPSPAAEPSSAAPAQLPPSAPKFYGFRPTTPLQPPPPQLLFSSRPLRAMLNMPSQRALPRRTAMEWTTPSHEEIDLNCEISSYANAEL